MTKPSRPQRRLTRNTLAASLKLNSMRPVAFTASWPWWVFSSNRRISLTENRPSTRTTNWMPSARWMLSPVKRYTPLLASIPTLDRNSPSSAASRVFSGRSPAIPPRQTMANTMSTKYSAGPKAIAHLASSGANRTIPQVAMKAPMNELQADSDRATPARPLRAIG